MGRLRQGLVGSRWCWSLPRLRLRLSMLAVLCFLVARAAAWGTSTHLILFDSAMEILLVDGWADVRHFYRENQVAFGELRQGTVSPDVEEAVGGTHYYVTSGARSGYGNYYRNARGHYSRSARTRFEEHYYTAINLLKNGLLVAALRALGKAIHYMGDVGCPVHAAGIRYTVVGPNVHKEFETYADKNCKKHMAESGTDTYSYVRETAVSRLLNTLGERVTQSKAEVKKNTADGFEASMAESIPLTQKHIAGILLRFYLEARLPATRYIRDKGVYTISLFGTERYIDSYYKDLRVWPEGSNDKERDFQKFTLSLNQDGSYTISPVSDPSKVLCVNALNSVVLGNLNSASNAHKFKIIPYPDGSARIVPAKNMYALVLGCLFNKFIRAQVFAPDNAGQRFSFSEVV